MIRSASSLSPEFVQVHRLVLQRPPQPLDEDVVVEAAPAVHRERHARPQHPVRERLAGELGALSVLRISGARRPSGSVQGVHAERLVHRVRQPPHEHATGRPVHDGHQVEKPLRDRGIGDVNSTFMAIRGWPPRGSETIDEARRGQRPSLFVVPGARLSAWPGALRGTPQC